MSLWMSHCDDCGTEGAIHEVVDSGETYTLCGDCFRADGAVVSDADLWRQMREEQMARSERTPMTGHLWSCPAVETADESDCICD